MNLSGLNKLFLDHIARLTGLLGSPPASWMLRALTEPCPASGRTHLESLMDAALGRPTRLCSRCMAFYLPVVGVLRGADGLARDMLTSPSRRRKVVSVVKGLGRFGAQRPLVMGSPFLVVWIYTGRCNLSCLHCHLPAGQGEAEGELSTAEALDVVDQLDRAGTVALAFSGGEPLLRQDFFQVAAHAASRGMYVSITTNGTLVTREVAARMARAGLQYVAISLDGASAEVHDRIRGGQETYARAIEAVRHCQEAGLMVCLAMTLHSQNAMELPGLLELSRSLGVERFMLYNFMPTGRGRNLKDITLEERDRALTLLYGELVGHGGVEGFTTDPQFHRVARDCSITPKGMLPCGHQALVPAGARGLAELIGGCGAGRFLCGIQPNGDVIPCGFLPLVAGSLRRRSFGHIWLDSPLLRDLRTREGIHGPCRDCPDARVCGGCRAKAYVTTGDPLASDPACLKGWSS